MHIGAGGRNLFLSDTAKRCLNWDGFARKLFIKALWLEVPGEARERISDPQSSYLNCCCTLEVDRLNWEVHERSFVALRKFD